MNPRDLVLAVLRGRDLEARQIVKDANREGFRWSEAPAPDFQHPTPLAIYAAIVEHLSSHFDQKSPPEWTKEVGPSPRPIYLIKQVPKRMWDRYRGPEPFRKRNIYTFDQYLHVL